MSGAMTLLLTMMTVSCGSISANISTNTYGGYTEAEIDLMAAVTFLEAGNQDIKGKQLVVDTILNRIDSPDFPDTVKEVVNQKGQFGTAGRAAKLKGEDIPIDCYGAVLSELGDRKSREVLYFSRGWGCGEKLFKHGDHYFSGERRRKNDGETA